LVSSIINLFVNLTKRIYKNKAAVVSPARSPIQIPAAFNYQKLQSLSFEAREKLTKIQPTSISQASRISGVSPSDISVLLVYMGR